MTIKEELEQLKNNSGIVVGVYKNKELMTVWKDEKNNIMHLMSDLYNKQLLTNSKAKIKSKYSYSNIQEVKVTEQATNYVNDTVDIWDYIYYNVPTRCGGYLDIAKMIKKMEEK